MKKIFFVLLFFVIFPKISFAVVANFQVNGLVQSSDGKVMPGSTVVFSDKSSHEISSSTTGSDGRYQALVPAGEYTVTVKAPAESKMKDIVFSGQIVNSDTSRDFTFNTGKTVNPIVQKGERVRTLTINKLLPIIALIVVVVIISGYMMLKKLRKPKFEEQKTV